MAGISSFKSFLHGQFHTKDLGMLKYFLGVEVMRSKREIFSNPCNSVFQTILCPTTFFFEVFLLVFLNFFEVQRCFVDCRITFYSSAVFFVERCSFSCKIQFFSYFSDFQRLVQVRSASMTNMKSSREVVCHYCHKPGHVRQNCKKVQNKNRKFQSIQHQKSLKSTSISISSTR